MTWRLNERFWKGSVLVKSSSCVFAGSACFAFSKVVVVRRIAMTKRFTVLAILVLGLLTFAAFLPIVGFAQNDAAGAIALARQRLITCYDSTRQAESAGANISSLTSVLNDAGNLLSQSDMAYSQDNFEAAQTFASQCEQRLENFVSDAHVLKDAAVQQRNFDFWVNAVGSVAGTFVVIAAGFAIWRVVKKGHLANEVETEVHTNEPSRV